MVVAVARILQIKQLACGVGTKQGALFLKVTDPEETVDGLDRSQIVIPFSCVSGHTQICSCVLFIINPLGKYVSFASASRRAKQ